MAATSFILATALGSFQVPAWRGDHPSEQAVADAARVVFDLLHPGRS